MSVEIRAHNIELSDSLRNYIEHRLHRSLRRFQRRVRRVTIRLRDINGPRGGFDKSCRIDAELEPMGRVVLEERHLDLYTAVDHASGRFQRSLSRMLKRVWQRKRRRESVRIRSDFRPGLVSSPATPGGQTLQ